ARGTGGADLAERWHQLEREEQTLAQQEEHLLEAITAYGPKPMFAQKLSELEAAERALASRRQALEALRVRPLGLPDSVAQLRRLLEEGFQKLALDSPEFGEFLRPLVPQFDVYLVRLCDGGHLLPRARVELALSGVVPDAKHVPGLGQLLKRELTL